MHRLSSCGSRALECRLSSCGAWALLLCSMWDLPGPGLEPMSPALAGGFLTTAPPGKSLRSISNSEVTLAIWLKIRAQCRSRSSSFIYYCLLLLETFFAPSRRAPTATFHDSKHNIVHVHFDATRGWLLTSGTDKVIKVGCCLILEAFHLWPCVNTQEPQDHVRSAPKLTLGNEHF